LSYFSNQQVDKTDRRTTFWRRLSSYRLSQNPGQPLKILQRAS